MIVIAVVDDDRRMRSKICSFIQGVLEQESLWFPDDPEECVVRTYGCCEDLLKDMENGKTADILISEIEMQGMNGIELGRKLRMEHPEIYVVYLTSQDRYATDSYIVEAYQYILKRDMEERLPNILHRLLCEICISGGKSYHIVQLSSSIKKIYYSDLIYAYKEKGSKYVTFVTEQEEVRERITMDHLIHDLKSEEFLLTDRSFLVNIRHVSQIRGNVMHLTGDHQIPVSRARLEEVKRRICEYWRTHP